MKIHYIAARAAGFTDCWAVAGQLDCWVPASGGREEPFTHNGVRWLYVWNSSTGEHAYLNLSTDIVSEDYA